MQVLETSGGWTAVVLAVGIALALIAGLFLVQRILRAWIRRRTGFTGPTRRSAYGIEEGLGLEEGQIQEPTSDAIH